MKKTAIAFGVFFLLLVLGLCVCIPGICGCAGPQILPDKWEQRMDFPVIVAELVGLAGCALSALLWLVLFVRHRMKKVYDAARTSQPPA